MRQILTLLMLATLFVLAGCRANNQATIDNLNVDVVLDSEAPTVGDATLLVTLTTDDGTAVDDATVSVRGDMTHAGMVPVLTDPITESNDGVYTVPVEFTMGGDWIFTVTVELANGDTTEVEYTVDGVPADGDMDMDMSDDDMSDMDMDMGSTVSGAYMTITNNREADVTLVTVTADGVGMVEIHETTVDDNDMASMQQIEDGLVIPAGETVDLVPGGLHLMLMNLENDVVEGDTVAITLQFDDETTVTFDAPVALMMPMDDAESIETDNLVVSGFWVRPTAAEDMSDMDMDDDSDMDMEATEESQ